MEKANFKVSYLPIKNNRQLLKAQPAEEATTVTFMCGGLRTPYLAIYAGKDQLKNVI